MEDRKQTPRTTQNNITRRRFIGATAAAAAAFTIVPRHVLGGPGYTPPSDKLNIAGVGFGGMGKNNLRHCAKTENIYALCDVDHSLKGVLQTFEQYPQAKRYQDFRVMLDKEPEIDGVVVATPDHTHAVVAMEAMRRGKHVYVQKPLTNTVYEARALKEAARKYKVVTQMGNQGHAGEGNRLMVEWVRAGLIGHVRNVHCWTNRPVWPQGIDRPTGTPKVPKKLDWDLWLGPAANRPYHPAYHPFAWRGFWDFGTGVMGDMGCHIADTPVWVLNLGHPTTVEAVSTPVNAETAPVRSLVTYEFPARGNMPPVTMKWHDGGLMPPRPAELEAGRRMGDNDGGVLLVGDKGAILCGCYGNNPRLIPEARMEAARLPEKSLKRVEGIEADWIQACKGGDPACSNFDVSGPLTEIVLLANLAIRSQKRLEWDGENMKVANIPEANRYVHREYREGWRL